MPNNKGVFISMYVESSQRLSDRKTDPIKKLNPKRFSLQPRLFKTRAYDRRAQLLAYAKELRHANSQHIQWPSNNSRPKHKGKWSLSTEKIRALFSRSNGKNKKWKYEQIITEDYCTDNEGSFNQERIRNKKRKANRRSFPFCKKIKCFLKEISRVWQCKSGTC